MWYDEKWHVDILLPLLSEISLALICTAKVVTFVLSCKKLGSYLSEGE